MLYTSHDVRLSLLRGSHNQVSYTSEGLIMNTSPWNKNRIIGQKKPLQISQIWGIRIRLELEGKTRDLALFNMALDSKLRGCDLVKLKVSDVAHKVVNKNWPPQENTSMSVFIPNFRYSLKADGMLHGPASFVPESDITNATPF